MTTNRTSEAVDTMLRELTDFGCIPCAVADSIPAIVAKYKRMEEALRNARRDLDHLQGESEVAIAVCSDIDKALALDPLAE